MKSFGFLLLALFGFFQISYSQSQHWVLNVSTIEQLNQFTSGLVSTNENNQTQFNFHAFNIGGIADSINSVLESIANASHPIHHSSFALVLPINSILPVGGVINFNNFLVDYDNFHGQFELQLLLGIIPRTARLELSLDRFFLTTTYKNNLRLGKEVRDYVPNDGKVEITIENFALDFNITKIDIGESENMIQDLAICLEIGDVKTHLDGLINDNEVGNAISDAISEMVERLHKNPEEINEKLGADIKEILNKIIHLILQSLIG